MDNFNTIDIQRLAVTPQYEDNTYIGLNSNGKLIRTNIDKAGGSDIDLSGYATEKWVKNQDYSTNSDVDEKVRQVNHKFYNYYTKEQVDDKIADIDIELSECVKENEIATINGISLTNGGNIIIQGGEGGTVDLSDYYTKEEVNDIVSDTNFKTIDGESIVGEGDIQILTNKYFVENLIKIEGDIVENRMIIDDIKDKQWGLKSGEEVISGNYGTTTIGNLKTVHGISLLGEGDINIFEDTWHIEWMKWVEDMIAEFKMEISKLKEK